MFEALESAVAQLRTAVARLHAGATIDHYQDYDDLATLATIFRNLCAVLADLAELLGPPVARLELQHPIQVDRMRQRLESFRSSVRVAERAAAGLWLWSTLTAQPRRKDQQDALVRRRMIGNSSRSGSS